MTLSDPIRYHLRNSFWILLFPASLLWGMISKLRRRFYPPARRYRSTLPIICVGNIHSGGSGKTPLIVEIATRLNSFRPVILTRGYLSSVSKTGAWLERSHTHGPEKYGDEPWMLSKKILNSIYVGRDRKRALKVIASQGENGLVLLDDGFQHLAIARTVDLVAINADRLTNDLFCLPLGDLREPVTAINSASAIILVCDEKKSGVESWQNLISSVSPTLPIFVATRRVVGFWDGTKLSTNPPSEKKGAFCGIAEPNRFRKSINSVAPDTVFLQEFGDHHFYTPQDLNALISDGRKRAVEAYVTTEKDYFKVEEFFRLQRAKLYSLRIGHELSDEFWYFLKDKLELF